MFEMALKHIRKLLLALAALVALSGLSAPTAGATTSPAPGYGQFVGCPNPAETTTEFCFHTVFTSGKLQLGKLGIPIANPITYSGGTTPSGNVVFNASGGMPPVPQSVPGGLVALTGQAWFATVLSPSELEVDADIELAGTPGAPWPETFSLPIKIHLTNPALGPNCYIGSNANPIVLDLITGTTSPPAPNKPITGTEPEVSFTPNEVVDFENGTYVDNSFAVPGANGCVLTLPGYIPISINGLINSQNGLPSAAGHNSAILDFDTELVESAVVYP
jgi:hypothetical protein